MRVALLLLLLVVVACVAKQNVKKCERGCFKVWDPVCGTDGKTYGNSCELGIVTCKTHGRITLAHKGKCDVCTLPKKVGRCRAAFPRFYYNSGSGRCEQFTYGGCGANDNNFKTLKECKEKTKHCSVEKCEKGCFKIWDPVCGTDGKTYGNSCELKIVTCKTDGRITLAHKGKCDVCTLPKEAGPCYARLPRYYYNSGSGKCELFYYGGCQANDNNFKTLKECKENTKHCSAQKCEKPCPRILDPVCGTDGKTYGNPCELEIVTCKTDGRITLAHKGKCAQRCEKPCPRILDPVCGTDGKTYGNPCILEIVTCKTDGRITLAHKGKCDVCTLPKKVGPCKGSIPRYYYNSRSGNCKLFYYGGCGGNDNNFKTLKECKEKTKHCQAKEFCDWPGCTCYYIHDACPSGTRECSARKYCTLSTNKPCCSYRGWSG